MEILRVSNRWMALGAGIFTIASAASPVRAADVYGNQSFADCAMPSQVLMPSEVMIPSEVILLSGSEVILLAGAVDPIDENSGNSPDSDLPDTAQPKPRMDELYNKMPDEVIGLDVVDIEGKLVGTVDDLVVDKAQSSIGAVVAIDQILGLIGGTKIVLPLDTLQLRGNQLQFAMSKNLLKTRPEYVKEYYLPIPEKDERPIGDFLAS